MRFFKKAGSILCATIWVFSFISIMGFAGSCDNGTIAMFDVLKGVFVSLAIFVLSGLFLYILND